jgi:hypothetical protein
VNLESIDEHAEFSAPECVVQRHDNLATFSVQRASLCAALSTANE